MVFFFNQNEFPFLVIIVDDSQAKWSKNLGKLSSPLFYLLILYSNGSIFIHNASNNDNDNDNNNNNNNNNNNKPICLTAVPCDNNYHPNSLSDMLMDSNLGKISFFFFFPSFT